MKRHNHSRNFAEATFVRVATTGGLLLALATINCAEFEPTPTPGEDSPNGTSTPLPDAGTSVPDAGTSAPPFDQAASNAECRQAVRIAADTVIALGKTAGAAVVGCEGALVDVAWKQTGGPTVLLLSDRTQAISFDAAQTGDYTFRVAYRDDRGNAGERDVAMKVVARQVPNTLTVRSDQAVRPLSNVSVRAWSTLAKGESITQIRWEQTAGVAVKYESDDRNRIVFVAPQVDKDSVLQFRATMQTASGATDSDDVTVLVEAMPPPPKGALLGTLRVSRVHPYRPGGRFANALVPCAADPNTTVSCKFSMLPLLAHETAGEVPTVEQVMERVVVSHDWMGANFEMFLRQEDKHGDLRRMLASVVAVVLSPHVRPSFYLSRTAAIYLDGNFLWLKAGERDLIDEAPDYRAGNGNGLQFTPLATWLLSPTTRVPFYRSDVRYQRTVSDLGFPLARVLTHELTHAADWIPPMIQASIDRDKSPAELASARYQAKEIASFRLWERLPLRSTELLGLGNVLYRGVAATDSQKALEAAQVGAFMSADGASDFYGYSTPQEDVAMMVEEFLMAHRRQAIHITSVTYRYPADPNQFLVAWGQYGRAGDAMVKPRLKQVLAEVLPWIDPASVEALPAPIPMVVGRSWADSLRLPTGSMAAAPASAKVDDDQRAQLNQLLRFQDERREHLRRP